MRVLTKFFIIISILLSFAATAGLIDNGTYSTDEVTGLDWLDINSATTRGKSYDDIEAELRDQNLEGWRFATSKEFDLMIKNQLGFAPDDYYSGRQYDGLSSLIAMMGSTASGVSDERPFKFLYGFVDSTNSKEAIVRQFGYKIPEGYFRPSTNAQWDTAKDTTSTSFGSFLVRENQYYSQQQYNSAPALASQDAVVADVEEVPEPSTFVMMFSALLFFGSRRLKKAKS